MPSRCHGRATYLVVATCLLLWSANVNGQVGEDTDDLADRPISQIDVVGLKRVSEQLVRNQLRTAVGDPYDPDTVSADVKLLTRLGEFSHVDAQIMLALDGTVQLLYVLVEASIIAEVQVVGNKLISDQDLLAVTRITRGLPRDDFLIENAKRAIEAKYRERGHYLTTVTIDESELDESGILFFRVIEGPRVRVKAIEFQGNTAFTDDTLHAETDTRTSVPLFRRGELDEEQLRSDVNAIADFYRARGYMDVRVDRTVELSPDESEVKITFLIAEGRRYTLSSVRTQPDRLQVFSTAQIESMLVIKPGDVYVRQKINASTQRVQDAYGLLGYLDVRVTATELRSSEAPEVDLLLTITEGARTKVGTIEITGNFLTKDHVVRRHFRGLKPGRPFDSREIDKTIERLRQTRLFGDVNISILDPDPANPGYRDVLVEVREANTGSVNFGIAAGSDSGFFGEFSIVQRNFDIADTPESFSELVAGRAFRGGGQRFSMTLRPGNEIFQYLISWTDPNIFDSDFSLNVSAQFFSREFRTEGTRLYDENRVSVPFSIGRRLGEYWEYAISGGYEVVKLDNINPTAPVDVFEAAGPDTLVSLALRFVRSTVTTFRRPDRGTRFVGSIRQFGGDYTFTKITGDYTVFLTPYRDAMGRAQILKLTGRLGYVVGDAPLYERFYLGGRSFRGFEFRTISPKGLDLAGGQTTDPVGGDWMMFLGAQYEIPLLKESITVVGFIDSGTVTDKVGFSEYRITVGAGLRMYIQQFGPVPIALDFGFPISSQDGDEKEVFSFSAELPF
ncbi:MAG: outer membrane protein assembly factor BamA [Planctomycetota bacterium]|nr:MAG: outer membrane protein assembly factor BamA [Planctomycetota bacterium]